jgi:hypothetical protein
MKKQSFKSAVLTMKLQMVVNELKKLETFQSGHWSSSEYLEQDLKSKGIVPPIEIYHKYKMPYGYTEKEYEDYVMWLLSLLWFEPNKILNIPEYVNKTLSGTNITDEEKQSYQNKLNKPVENLSDDEKSALVELLLKEQKLAPKEILNQINMVKNINPEVKDIKINTGQEADFLIGITSGFHPDDIKYFLSITDFDKAREEKKKLGMNTYALFMEPKRMQKIIDAVQEHSKLNTMLGNKTRN